MRETQRNIRAYKKRLVGVKEKLATAGLLFLMSAVMLTTASFAWITLSVAPEVANISTTVVGNGNLEIALVNSDENGLAKLPEESQVGDSNKNLVEKNITWGNLVNLNDNSYGLNKIVLRPATLNTSSTLESPLRAIEYDKDGRYKEMNYEFSYSNYNTTEDMFVIDDSTSYGVRAISSVLLSASGEDAERNVELRNDIVGSLETAKATYMSLVTNSTYIDSIADLMGVFLTDKLNDTDSDVSTYLPTFYKMMQEYELALNQLGETYVKIANVQISKKNLALDSYTSLDQLLNESESTLSTKGIKLMSGFDKLKSIKTNLPAHMKNVHDSMNAGEVKMATIQPDINYMVEINTCKIDDKYTVAGMGSMSKTEMLGMLSGTHKGEVQAGALKDFEQLTGAKMDAKNISISAKYLGMSASVKANISTAAKASFTVPVLINGDGFSNNTGNSSEYTNIVDLIFGDALMIETAADVYGMSIDLWLRTNISDSYLILEGKSELVYEVQTTASNFIIYENEEGRQFYHIPDSEHPAPAPSSIDPLSAIIYVVNEEVLVDHYLNFGSFYAVATNQPVNFSEVDEDENGVYDTRETFVKSLEYSPKTVVTGYDGVNRIWEESADLVEGTSSTQGKGSCFIFYPEDPLEQERMLKVLSALSVAFIDDTGYVLARATLNPEHAYEEVGKVTIPLELASESNFYLNEEGKEVRYITEMIQNESKMISAIVYIDGEQVSNEDVNATSSVKGYLNLQFGSSAELNPIIDEDLQNQYVKATATVSDDFFEVTEIPATTTVNLEIKGVNTVNSTVHMNFVRKINDYQGVQLDPVVMTLISSTEDSSSLTGNQTFNNPGVYVLNSIWIDGIEYELEHPVSVEVEGFKINSLIWDQTSNDIYKMTSENKYDVELTVDVAASEQFKPSKMSAMFRNEYNEYVTVYLTENAGKWKGIGSFITSGKYNLQYLYINDDIYYIDSEFNKTISLVLGINASVDLEYIGVDSDTNETIQLSGSNIQFEWDAKDLTKNVVNIKSVKICDNKGNIIEGLEGVKLYYGLTGSTNMNIYAELVWNADEGMYTGKLSSDNKPQQFLISTPGVYKFDRVFIADTSTENPNDGSEIRKAISSTVITATSPYPVEFLENTLLVEEYQFAPNKDASFSVQMKHSSAASVYAKMIYYGNSTDNEGVVYYIPGVQTHNDTETFVTTWSFTPMTSDGYQDGLWELEDIRLANVYAPDNEGGYKWYSIPEDEWWTSTVTDTYVIWDVVNDKMNILGKIKVSAFATDNMDATLDDVFTTSLSETYSISGYTISYSDNLNRTVDNTLLKPYGLEIVSNTVTYLYSKDTEILDDSSGWLDKIGTSNPSSVIDGYKNDIEGKTITFASTDSIIMKYPGTYTPVLKITLNKIGTDGSKTPIEDNTKVLTITNELKSHKVSWKRPDARFTSYSPTSSRTVFISYQYSSGWFGVTYVSGMNSESRNNSINSDTNTINAYFNASYKIGYVNYDSGTTATVTLTNGGSLFTEATCTIDTTSDTKFVFNNGATTASDIIGRNAGGTLEDKLYLCAGYECKSIVFTYNGTTYTFTLPLSLKVGENR